MGLSPAAPAISSPQVRDTCLTRFNPRYNRAVTRSSFTTPTGPVGATAEASARRLLKTAPTGSRVILFGSHARGDHDSQSDLDFLVVEPDVTNAHREMARLRCVLSDCPLPVDVLVMSDAAFSRQAERPSSVAAQARREGRVYR